MACKVNASLSTTLILPIPFQSTEVDLSKVFMQLGQNLLSIGMIVHQITYFGARNLFLT
jgi:hypothetical protein